MMEEFQMEETNNYEKWCEQWREKFLKMDQEELKKKAVGIKGRRGLADALSFRKKAGSP